ncbi:DNA repair protein RadC [Neobacillus sp. YIM B02564]|uniref:DNA repair protein RadC n=1 Tax=Neobacillus paridis TaxID=2803862 RepID=A0ABS1TQD9_9BACI|nr:DNA repair protein RadC [Neobacillus paridis]MBL4952095.1 DNA repair protein RadC [Neobacillus paridis]
MKRINIFTIQQVKEKGSLYNLESKKVISPESAVKIVNTVLGLNQRSSEHFAVITLNAQNEVAGVHPLFKGSLNAAIVHPREVFQAALLNNAASIICFHNHPSGNPEPSKEDIDVTKRLAEAGQILGIQVLDHIIIGDGKFVSLKQKGYF